EPPPPSHFRPDVDRRLEAICRKAMARKVEDRYGDMAEFAAALDAYLRVSADPLPKTSIWTRRRVLIGAGLVAALFISVLFFARDRESPGPAGNGTTALPSPPFGTDNKTSDGTKPTPKVNAELSSRKEHSRKIVSLTLAEEGARAYWSDDDNQLWTWDLI